MYQGISNTFVPITEHQRHFRKPKPYVSTVTKTCHINSQLICKHIEKKCKAFSIKQLRSPSQMQNQKWPKQVTINKNQWKSLLMFF